MSYAKVDSAGKTRLPSYLIRVMTGLFPKLHVQTEIEENEGFLAEVESAEDGLDDFAGLLRKYREGSLEKTALPKLRVLQKVYDTPDAEKIREAAFTDMSRASCPDRRQTACMRSGIRAVSADWSFCFLCLCAFPALWTGADAKSGIYL